MKGAAVTAGRAAGAVLLLLTQPIDAMLSFVSLSLSLFCLCQGLCRCFRVWETPLNSLAVTTRVKVGGFGLLVVAPRPQPRFRL